MTKEEKKQEVEVEEKSELKDWQKERNLGAADKLQHQADDLIENIGDKIGNLFRSKKKQSKWAEILGRQASDEEDKKPGDSNEPEKPKHIHVNPLLAKMRKKGLLKKKLSSSVFDMVNKSRLEKADAQRKSSGEGSVGSTSTPAKEPTKDVTKEETSAKSTAPQKKPDQETEDDVDKSEPMPKKTYLTKKLKMIKQRSDLFQKMLHCRRKALMQMLVAQLPKLARLAVNAAVPLAPNAAVRVPNAAVPLVPNAAVPLVPNAAVPLVQTQQYRRYQTQQYRRY